MLEKKVEHIRGRKQDRPRFTPAERFNPSLVKTHTKGCRSYIISDAGLNILLKVRNMLWSVLPRAKMEAEFCPRASHLGSNSPGGGKIM